MGFYLSPQVAVIETDLTNYIPAIPTGITGMVGNFKQGPVNQRVLITNEQELVDYFGKPDNDTYTHFFSAWNFLQYANQLYVVRAAGDDTGTASTLSNSNVLWSNAGVVSNEDVLIKNQDDYLTFIDSTQSTFLDSDVLGIIARYPGEYGNNLKVAAIGWTVTTASTVFATSSTTSNIYWNDILPNKMRDPYNLAIVVLKLKDNYVHTNDNPDAYDIVEKWMVSTTQGVKDGEGNSIYIEDTINQSSKYIYAFFNDSTTLSATFAGTAVTLSNGFSGTYSVGAVMMGYDLFTNPEEFDINLIIDGGNTDKEIQQYINDNIILKRRDCFGIFCPPKADVVNVSGGASQIVTNLDNYINEDLARGTSSYAAFYGNWKYQYDKFNDKYRWVPLSGDMAGIYALTDYTRDPWFAPAGFNRGSVKNVVRLAWSPNLAQRDMLYKENINPVVQFRGEGPIVFGQKTLLNKPSAFDRVDVRRLFLVLEKAISTSSKYFLFEKNNDFTRRMLIGMIDPFLRDVVGRQGLYDFRVKCDESNNTGEVIDRNELVCDIYLKPTKTAEFIVLNFIATRTGVEFSEVGA